MENIPQGFAQALTKNEDAVNTYAMMTREEKEKILKKANQSQSKQQMEQLVNALAREQKI